MIEQQAEPAQNETSLMGNTTEADLQKETPAAEQTFQVREEEDAPVQDTGKFERPKDISDELWDADNGTFKSDALYKEYKKEKDKALGLRQKLAKGASKPPESPDQYVLNNEKVAERLNVEIPEDDAGFAMFKEVAHKNGLDQETFENVYMDYMEKAIEHNKNLEQAPVSEEEQKEYIDSEMKKLGDTGPQIINGIKAFNKQLYQSGIFSDQEFKTANSMGKTAEEVRILAKYREAAGNMALPEKVGMIDGMESESEIQSIMMKPEYKKDPALQKKVEDFYKKKYG
jgi:hypothetical protein